MSVYKDNYIFIHIPRVAGSSMEQVLGLQGHGKIKAYYEFFKYLSLGLPKWEDLFKFAFVREPIDRFISGYLAQNKDPKKINEFIESPGWSDNIFFQPQFNFVSLIPGKVEVDFIGRFENLEQDWKYVCKELGIKHKLKHLNKSKKKVVKLNETSRRILRSKYDTDYRMFYP